MECKSYIPIAKYKSANWVNKNVCRNEKNITKSYSRSQLLSSVRTLLTQIYLKIPRDRGLTI